MGAEWKAVAVVELEGDIDLAAVPDVERRIAAAEDGRPDELVLDLRQVTFMDSSGLRALLGAHHRADERGCEFAVVRGSDAVERLLEMTGLANRLRLLDEPPPGASGADV